MVVSRSRTVWVLGSGFSVPLGGPTLGDLFGPEGHHDLVEIYRDHPKASLIGQQSRLARQLFLYGTRFAHGSLDSERAERALGERLWTDAEAFLDSLETAALSPEGAGARRLEKIVAGLFPREGAATKAVRVSELRDAARRLLAIDCSRFLFNPDLKSERWEPYLQWLGHLRQASKSGVHTIITFNYDLVLETLGLAGRVLIPEDADEPDYFADDTIPNVAVLKLHGSVDWRVTKNGIVRVRGKHLAAIGKASELAIAPPGPAKAEIARNSFGRIWARATAALESATAVVFIGYRFPETDARARSRLLSALPKAALTHIVLGADTRHPHAARMHGLLRTNRPHSRVVLHPLFSQDFMTVWNGQSLSDADAWRASSAPPP